MKALVCEIDDQGVRRCQPETLLANVTPDRLTTRCAQHQSSVVWALLEEPDAEELRVEVGAGHYRDACSLLLNRAIELLPISAAAPTTIDGLRML